jgi:lysosomal Pro-X carboxypeptidase
MIKHVVLSVIVALMSVSEVSALGSHRSIKMKYPSGEKAKEYQKSLGTEPTENNFTVRIDHFNGSYDDTFEMRYLENDQYYNGEYGPILFYAGNEGDVWNFYNNSGFVTETLAKELGAKVIFAEHRYYGTSMPFLTAEASYADVEHRRFLSIEQVMWDYIKIIEFIKDKDGMQDRAVIAFGGSYGGMLAAWLRIKYPQHFQGAIAASAPILWFEGKTDPSAFTEIASKAIMSAGGQTCYDSIKYGFFDLVNIKYDTVQYANIDKIFNICGNSTIKSSEDIDNLIGLLSDSLGTMAMVNYPYATDFINPLPAWPIAEACKAAGNYTPPTTADPPTTPSVFNLININQLQSAANVFYNWEKTQECLDLSQS